MTQSAAVSKTSAEPDQVDPATFTRKQFWGLILMSATAYFATSYLFKAVGFFSDPGFNSSLMLDASPIKVILLLAIWVLIVGVAMTFIGKAIRPDAGVFAAAVALWAVRRSGGMARNVFQANPTAKTLQMLAVEAVVLGVVLAILFLMVRRLVACKSINDDADIDLIRPQAEPLGQRLLATATQALVMMVLLLITLRSDERMQVTGMVAVSAMLAALSTVRFIPATPSIYFWMGPIVVGVFGFIVNSFGGTANLPIGDVAGYFGPLARAMPLDYASAGVVGALYGYWTGRAWIPEDALEAE